MANTLTAQFAPSASMRITDPTMYASIVATYGFGTPIIYGVSPQTLATTYGINYVDNPTTTDYQNLPCVFTVPAQSKVLGTTIATNLDGVQSLGGQSYTDPNGMLYTTVTWEWAVEVQFFAVADRKTFSQQVVTWTGDGAANRLIPTSIDLSTGVTAIMIFGTVATPVLCTSAMIAAGKHATWSISPASTTLGVMTMEATGFRVTNGASVNVNQAAVLYTAVVWNDGGDKMQVGSYAGAYDGVTATGQTITTGLTDSPTTMLLVTGRSGAMVYAESDNNVAFCLQQTESTPLTGIIPSLLTNGFTVGANNNVNSNLLTYYWVAFAIPTTDPIRTSMFQVWKVVGTAAVDDHVTGLGFTPGFAIAREYLASPPITAWRGPNDAGTVSHSIDTGATYPSTAIDSFAAGDIGIGSAIAPNGTDGYGFALKAAVTTSSYYPTPTWVHTENITNDDGTVSAIQTTVESQTIPSTFGGDWTLVTDATPSPSWWCNATFGYSVYQIDSPGTGWAACSGPATDDGWYRSTEAFGGADIIVSGGRPADPRTWAKIAVWATGNTNVFGGSPQAACVQDNCLVYPASGYTVGTDYPPIRSFNGRGDRELCRLPPTVAGTIPKAVLSMLAANGTIYLTTFDSGTTSANWNGRVFELNVSTGVLTVLGTVFANGEMPYALAWHMGRLWCGTNNGIGTVGKVYFFRPGIDTAWTQDFATSTLTAGGVLSMASFLGKLYVGTDNAAASRGKVLVRDTAGAYTLSQTGAGSATAAINNGYLALTVFGANLYASYWNNDPTLATSKIEKFTGSAWSTVYTGALGTLRPYIVLKEDAGNLFAVGGGKPHVGVLLSTATGTSWTDLTAELPENDETLLPMFGCVVT